MFEQSMIEARVNGARGASFAMSVTLQCAAVGAALLVPLLVTEQIRPALLFVEIMAPPPAAGRPVAVAQMVPAPAAGRMAVATRPGAFHMPASIPVRVAVIEDEAPSGGGAITAGNEAGVVGGVGDPRLALGTGIMGLLKVAPQPAPPPVQVTAKAAAEPKPLERVVVGGKVQAAKLTNPVQPVYPSLARQARISGVVQLAALIGRDGRIVNLRALGGHPLLIPAAMDAVRLWVYSPTLLNGEAVEVSTSIDVHFTLQ